MRPHGPVRGPGQPGLEPLAWVLAASPASMRGLRPLIEAHGRSRPVRVLPAGLPSPGDLAGAAAVLVVGPARRAPSTQLPGLFLPAEDGRSVPTGWLPELDLDTFARGAASVVARSGPLGPVIVLGQWQRRYLRLAQRMEVNLGEGIPSHRWTAERITRDDMAAALRLGIGLAVYFGHGRPSGWAGYHGTRAGHLCRAGDEPLGALVSTTCRTASRWRIGLSFSEQVVLGGAAASALGAVSPVLHLESMRWMLGLASALRAGESLLGPALLRAAPPGTEARDPYRIIGDPLASLRGTPEGFSRAELVHAPSPDELVASA